MQTSPVLVVVRRRRRYQPAGRRQPSHGEGVAQSCAPASRSFAGSHVAQVPAASRAFRRRNRQIPVENIEQYSPALFAGSTGRSGQQFVRQYQWRQTIWPSVRRFRRSARCRDAGTRAAVEIPAQPITSRRSVRCRFSRAPPKPEYVNIRFVFEEKPVAPTPRTGGEADWRCSRDGSFSSSGSLSRPPVQSCPRGA